MNTLEFACWTVGAAVLLNIYGEWYWRIGKGKAKKLARQRRKK